MDYLKTIAILIAFVLTWTLSYVLTIVGLKYIAPTTFVLVRFAIASLFMLAIFGRRPIQFLKKASRLDIFLIFLAAISGVVLTYLLQVIRRYSNAPPGSDIVFLQNVAPIFIFILVVAFRMEKLTLGKVAAMAAAVLGMIIIVANWEKPSSFSPFSRFSFEEGLILLSAISFAIFAFAGKKVVERYPPSAVAAVTVWLGTLLLFPLANRIDGFGAVLKISFQGWLIALILGILSSALSILLFYDALARVEATKVGSALFLTPIIITLLVKLERVFGLAFFPSPLFVFPIIVGSVLVFIGVVALWVE